MNAGILTLIIILMLIVVGLVIYNLLIRKKIKALDNTNEKINNLRVLQDFMDTVGKETLAEDKIKVINDILLEKYNIKYSTIVTFNGAEYVLKATNVDERLWDIMKNLHTDEMFKDSISTATPKYVTINNSNEKLSYQKMEMARAKSAMFFPLYIDNVYIGYWIIESGEAHAFDKMDTSILSTIKDNIVTVLKMVSYQTTVENIFRVDKTTGLYSAEYLYGKGKNLINRFDQSTICMFNVTNIEEINKDYGRDVGTRIIVNVTNTIKSNISAEYIFVRYMGPKFAIAFSGADIDAAGDFVKMLKENLNKIQLNLKSKNKKKEIVVSPKTNFVLATYYKGTGIEEVTKKLEEYLDNVGKDENTINSI